MTNKPSAKPEATAAGGSSARPSVKRNHLARVQGDSPALALDMSPDAITLHQRAPGGWQVIGRADPQASDFSDQIEWLRVEALARTATPQPVLIWLPADQVLIREHAIEARGSNARRSAAADHFERSDKLRRDELEIAVSPPVAGDPAATCLAILAQTRREAEEYATRWGFQPGDVTCRGYEARFGGYPRFQACDTVPVRHARTGATYAGIGMSGLAVASLAAVALWGVLQFGKEQLRPPPPVISDVGGFAAVRLADTGPAPAVGLSASARAPAAQGLAWPSVVRDATQPQASHPMRWTAAFTAFDGRRVAPDLGYHMVSERLALGHAPSPAGGARQIAALTAPVTASSTLPQVQPLEEQPPAAIVAAIVAETAQLPQQVAAVISENEAQPVEARAIDNLQLTTLTPVVSLPDEAPQPIPRRTKAEPEETPVEAPLEPARDPAADAPNAEAPIAPETTETESTDETLLEIAVWTEASGVPLPTHRPPGEAAATSEPTEQPTAPETAEPLELAIATELEPEPELGLAAALEHAPVPRYRPDHLATQINKAVVRVLTATAPADPPAPVPSGPVARSVRQAATQEGLPLERTSLIGIINVSSGREALIRLPNGRFRRVGRGDVLDGWEVSLIGRDALRLSRSGKNHTLLLVGR